MKCDCSRKERKEMEQREFKCRMCGACCRIKDGIVRIAAFLEIAWGLIGDK